MAEGWNFRGWNFSKFVELNLQLGTSEVHVLGRETHWATIKLDLSICPAHPPIEEMKYDSVAISVFLWIPCLIFEVCYVQASTPLLYHGNNISNQKTLEECNRKKTVKKKKYFKQQVRLGPMTLLLGEKIHW